MDQKLIKKWLPVALWCLLIFILSAIPQLQATEKPLLNFLSRKTAHLAEYGILATLIFRALGYKKTYLSFMLTLIYALTDEIHQQFVPTRTGKLSDIIFDGFGAWLGLYLSKQWKKSPTLPKKLSPWRKSS